MTMMTMYDDQYHMYITCDIVYLLSEKCTEPDKHA